jgi:hypothetical protein
MARTSRLKRQPPSSLSTDRPRKPNRNYVSVLQLIVGPKYKAIEREKRPEPLPKPKLNDRQKQEARIYRGTLQAARRIQKRFQADGLDVHEDGSVSRPYGVERQRVWDHEKRQAERLAKINTLKVKAMVDLLDIDPKAAQTYLRKVERALAKI